MTDAPGSPSAHQKRSLVTQDLLCDAAEAALRSGGLAACTIQEVARRAGRSVGSVYRRFGDKDHMIAAVAHRYLERTLSLNATNFSRLADRHGKLADRLRQLIDSAIINQRREWNLVKGLQDAAARSPNPELNAAMVRMQDAMRALARQALLGCKADINQPDPEMAVDFTLLMLAGAIETMMQQPDPQITDDRFRTELYDMLHGYLAHG